MNVSLEKREAATNIAFNVLSQLLSNTYVLYVKTQNFHWNVKGPRFHQLHLFFEEQYQALATAIDEIAERIRILGLKPPSTMTEYLNLSRIGEAPETYSENQMLEILRDDHELLAKSLTDWIAEVQKTGDEGTADLLVERIRYHEKTSWMISSHIE